MDLRKSKIYHSLNAELLISVIKSLKNLDKIDKKMFVWLPDSWHNLYQEMAWEGDLNTNELLAHKSYETLQSYEPAINAVIEDLRTTGKQLHTKTIPPFKISTCFSKEMRLKEEKLAREFQKLYLTIFKVIVSIDGAYLSYLEQCKNKDLEITSNLQSHVENAIPMTLPNEESPEIKIISTQDNFMNLLDELEYTITIPELRRISKEAKKEGEKINEEKAFLFNLVQKYRQIMLDCISCISEFEKLPQIKLSIAQNQDQEGEI